MTELNYEKNAHFFNSITEQQLQNKISKCKTFAVIDM